VGSNLPMVVVFQRQSKGKVSLFKMYVDLLGRGVGTCKAYAYWR
jgi:hypothetical protein